MCGFYNLYCTDVTDDALANMLFALSQESEALYDVCVACQAFFTHGGGSQEFYEFYSQALSNYRSHLDHPLMTSDEAIVNAALLLCTAGILQGTIWTIHLHGIERLLDERAAMSPLTNARPSFVMTIEVMGIMDIARFSIGRQTPSLQAWRRYREGKLVKYEEQADAVQSMVGLPRSMLDLVAMDNDQLSEEQVLLWPGCEGSYLQCQLWEAYRFTLMLTVRQHKEQLQSPQLLERKLCLNVALPSTSLLMTRALSSIDAIFNGTAQTDAVDSLVLNAIYWPLFHISLMVLSSEDMDGRHTQIRDWWELLISKDEPAMNTRNAWEVIQSVTSQHRQGIYSDPDQVAMTFAYEVCLF